MNVTVRGRTRHYRTVAFDAKRNSVLLIEQRLLPHEFKIIGTRDFLETAAAIRDMIVRGAGAIGATAAYGLAQGARAFRGRDMGRFGRHVELVYNLLKAARLTAAERFADEDVRHCEAIGHHGRKLIRKGMNVLTHCNAGWLAFVDVGSATAPIYAAQAKGVKFHVFCDETRPRCQGATLTAWELAQQGISHEVLADNA